MLKKRNHMKQQIKILLSTSFLFCNIVYSNPNNERPKQVNPQNNMRTTPSGLKIEILEHSKLSPEKKPHAGKEVVVHYTGWLMTEKGEKGSMFDSSHKRGQPFKFVLGAGQVIKGWDEGIALLTVGDKARLIIPANLAYGNRSVGSVIRANSTLIFDVELVDAA